MHARKAKALTELATLQQKSNEALVAYISRADVLKETIAEFDVFNDTSYFVVQTLQGLLKQYEVFKTIIDSAETLPEWDQFKVRIQSHAQLHKPAENTSQIMLVTNPTTLPVIQKKRKQNFKKFINKSKCTKCFSFKHATSQCDSTRWCNYCNNANHDTDFCRIKGNNSNRGGGGGAGRGNLHNYSRGRGGRGAARARGRKVFQPRMPGYDRNGSYNPQHPNVPAGSTAAPRLAMNQGYTQQPGTSNNYANYAAAQNTDGNGHMFR